jgi:biotin synthase
VGTGFMIGLPGQTYDDLANDLLCLKEMDIDMVGMGPFIPHPCTPLSKLSSSEKNFFQVLPTPDMTYRCIAIARCLCPLANIPATTALCVLDKDGLRCGLSRGANVFMHTHARKISKILRNLSWKTNLSPPDLTELYHLIRSIVKTLGMGREHPRIYPQNGKSIMIAQTQKLVQRFTKKQRS